MLRTHTGRDLGDSQELSVVLLLLESVSHPLVTVPGVTLRCGDCLHCARARAILGVPMRHAGPSGALNGDVKGRSFRAAFRSQLLKTTEPAECRFRS